LPEIARRETRKPIRGGTVKGDGKSCPKITWWRTLSYAISGGPSAVKIGSVIGKKSLNLFAATCEVKTKGVGGILVSRIGENAWFRFATAAERAPSRFRVHGRTHAN
jgi:hypothetical protein